MQYISESASLLLLDGSINAGNVNSELLLVVWFDKKGVGEKVCAPICVSVSYQQG